MYFGLMVLQHEGQTLVTIEEPSFKALGNETEHNLHFMIADALGNSAAILSILPSYT